MHVGQRSLQSRILDLTLHAHNHDEIPLRLLAVG